jgi:hypothetical protein
LIAVIIEGQIEPVNQFFRDRGFVDCDYDPLQRQLLPLRSHGANRIWIRAARIAEVRERLKDARERMIYGSRF